MDAAIWIGLAVVVLIVAILRLASPSLGRLADRAARSGDLAPVLAAISSKPESVQPTLFNHAIRRLWDSYQRETAVDLLRELARNYGTAHITQYWLKQVQQVEPALARDRLGKEFLDTYYLPELAAQCGPVG